MSLLNREEAEALIQEVLEVYPEKAKKDRAKHLMVNDKTITQSKKCITSNRKSVPGVMTQRGCAYAGARGVVWGPFKDIIAISHGPIGCGQYSRGGRRNYFAGTSGIDSCWRSRSTGRRHVAAPRSGEEREPDRTVPVAPMPCSKSHSS